jgi:hypothetical protein
MWCVRHRALGRLGDRLAPHQAGPRRCPLDHPARRTGDLGDALILHRGQRADRGMTLIDPVNRSYSACGVPGERAKRAMPTVRTAKPALAWRYPTRTPGAIRITSPPAPGKAAVASAHSETGSRVRLRHAAKTTAHPSERRDWALAVPSRAAMTLDLSGSSRRKSMPPSPRAVQPRLRWLQPRPRCRPTARPGYRQRAHSAAPRLKARRTQPTAAGGGASSGRSSKPLRQPVQQTALMGEVQGVGDRVDDVDDLGHSNPAGAAVVLDGFQRSCATGVQNAVDPDDGVMTHPAGGRPLR